MIHTVLHTRILYFLAVCSIVSIMLFAPDTVHAYLSVSGSVTIPTPAPAGGVNIDVYLEDTEGYSSVARNVTILEGNDSVTFSSLDTDIFNNGRLRYACLSNCGDIYPAGYLTPAGTSFKWEDARVFTVGTYTSVNIDLPLGYRVTGEVRLPELETASGTMELEVIASETVCYYPLTDYITISSGNSSAGYSLLLPPDPSGFWTINYSITSGGQNMYYHTGYYVTQVSTTYKIDNATKLYGSMDYSSENIDMTILWGKTITGSLSVPNGRQAPSGGMDICLETLNYGFYGGDDDVTVTIPEGESSADYSLIMPLDQYESWEVRYTCCYSSYSQCQNEGYLTTGYYAGQGQPTFYASKDYNLWAGDNHSGIDLNLISANVIGGKLTLPKAAPAGGIWVDVYADDPVYPGAMRDTLFLPAGSQSASYEVFIPDDSTLNWRISHRFDSKIGYVQQAYYSTSGTTHLINKATMLNGGTDHYHIDMNALPDKDNDGIPDSLDTLNNTLCPGIPILLLNKPVTP